MPVFLIPIVTWISHNLSRTIGVIIVGSLLIGMPILAYKSFVGRHYNIGYKAGYAQAVKDHPSVVQGDYYANGKEGFFVLKVWKFKISV